VRYFNEQIFVAGQQSIDKHGSFAGGSKSFIEIRLKFVFATWELKRDFVKFPIFALVLVFF